MNLFSNQTAETSLPAFALNLALAAVLGFLLGVVYTRFGRSLSNRRQFSRNFMLLTLATALVISIVKSSLALSLGLVGALSIVRFRAAIKEPEELVYLFLAISVGLGLGAGQWLVTLLSFTVIVGIILLQRAFSTRPDPPNLHLTVTGSSRALVGACSLQNLLASCRVIAHLTRLEEGPDTIEVAFRLAPADTKRLEDFNKRLREMDPDARVAYVTDRSFAD